MSEIVIRLSDQGASKYFFGHQIGERLRSRTGDLEGILKDATFAGPDDGGACEVTCNIQTANGEIIRIRLVDLVTVEAESVA